MKKLPILLTAMAGILSGCVAYPFPHHDHGHRGHDRDRDGISNHRDRDRDGDGVRNRRDSYPNNPRRY